jgi:4-amino-4-deoxy-L-arabinose transferase-like glycosyltransferase
MHCVPQRLYPTPRATAISTRRFPFLSSAVVVIVALLPRVLNLGRFVTFDEANFWLKRSAAFLQALTSGDLAATAITLHPGVTTMWLGSIGILLHRALLAIGVLANDTFAARLALAQLPVALAHTAGVLLGYWLLRRLMHPSIAFLGALLWATDPFVIGYSRILHVDALAGTFLTVSLLAACAYWHHQGGINLLAFSAVCASLAVLSKSPAAALLPIIAVVALASERAAPASTLTADTHAGRWAAVAMRLRRAAGPLLAWVAVFLLASMLLWPALLAAPARVADLLALGVSAEGAQPHQLGNFFLGQAYAEVDPGLRYYPVALVLRATPWTLLGLLLLPLALAQVAPRTRRDVLALAAFVILFTLTMDLFPKKFDRYLVPAFPAIDILVAVGLQGAFLALRRDLPRGWLPRRLPALGSTLLTALVSGAGIFNLVAWHPYEIGAFNQLLGGARTGAETFVVGWGEGLEQAAVWLNQQPDITGVTVAALRTEPLQAYLRAGAQAVAPQSSWFAAHTGYAVVYLPDVQGGQPLPPFDIPFGQGRPAHEVVIHGITYAWIYQLPPPVTHQLLAQFGPGLRLRGYALDAEPRPGKQLTVTLYWGTNAHPPSDVALFVHVLGSDGTRYAQVDPVLPVESWGPNRFFTTSVAFVLPATLAAGHYELMIGVYDRATGERMALQMLNSYAVASDGPNALRLIEFDLAQIHN